MKNYSLIKAHHILTVHSKYPYMVISNKIIAMTTEPSMDEGAETRPSLFSLIEAGEWERLDQSLQEDEGLAKELASFSKEGRRPLELAAMLGKGDVARVLVNRAGAEVNTSNKSGMSLSSLAIHNTIVSCC